MCSYEARISRLALGSPHLPIASVLVRGQNCIFFLSFHSYPSPKYPLPPCLWWRTLPIKSHLSKKPPLCLCLPPHSPSPLPLAVFFCLPLLIFSNPLLLPLSLFLPLNAMDDFPHSQSSTSAELKKKQKSKREVSKSKKGCTVAQIEKEPRRGRKG